MIDMTVDYSQVTDLVHEMQTKSQQLPLNEIGELAVESIHTTFEEGGRPEPWIPGVGEPDHQLLIDTGELMESIEFIPTGTGVKIDSPLDYAVFQDLGTSTIPPRPFMLLQDSDSDEIATIIADHFVEE
jgi:phage gpG-like protein